MLNLTFKYLIKDLNILLLLSVIITLPFLGNLNSIFIVLLLFSVIIGFKYSTGQKFSGIHIIFLLIFFFINIPNIADYHRSFTIKEFEKTLSWVAFPLIFFLWVPPKKVIFLTFKLFSIFIFLAVILCILFAVYRNYQEGILRFNTIYYLNEWFFSYVVFVKPIGLHPSYFAIYIFFSMVFIYFNSANFSLPFKRILILFILFTFSFGIFLLGSRIGIIFLLIWILIFFLNELIYRRKIIEPLIFLTTIVMAFVIIYNYNQVLSKRINESLFSTNFNNDTFGGKSLRFAQWQSLLSDVPNSVYFIGMSKRDYVKHYSKKYEEFDLDLINGRFYNAHNQYIDYLFIGGIPLVLLYFTFIGYYLFKSFFTKHSVMLIFLIAIILFGITESFLLAQKGLVFTLLFIHLLYLQSYEYIPKNRYNRN